MAAICKTMEIHSNDIQPVLNYISNKEKTDLSRFKGNVLEISDTLLLHDVGKQILVSGVLCNSNTANLDFAKVRNTYKESHSELLPSCKTFDKKTGTTTIKQKEPVVAVHVIQSFKGEINPQVAHQIGIELCERLGVQGVVATHLNTNNYHNHIAINAYMPDGETKFCLNKEKRNEIRRISDNIQREYGIEIKFKEPEIQQKLSQKSKNYKEWQGFKDGTSWKKQMHDEILEAREFSDTPEEFKEIMQSNGYKIIKENENNIMWQHTNGKKVWDVNLGEECSLNVLFKKDSIEKKDMIEKPDIKIKPISVSKFDDFGHQRSKIELTIRRAIYFIQKAAILLKKIGKDQYYNENAKLQIMESALKTLDKQGIKDNEQLTKAINKVKSEIDNQKSVTEQAIDNLNEAEVIKQAILNYQNAKEVYDKIVYWKNPHNLCINNYSAEQIQENRAKINPLNNSQRAQLYSMMLTKPNLKIKNAGIRFCNISASHFHEIKSFMEGKCDRPDYIIDAAESKIEFSYKKSMEKLNEIFKDKPKAYQIKEAGKFLSENGHPDFFLENLTMADYINIKNCYSPNPYSSPVIDFEKQKELKIILDSNNLVANRPLDAIMLSEYEQIKKFAEHKTKFKPQILKDALPATAKDIEKIKDALFVKNIKSTVPPEKMTQNDIRIFHNWIIAQNKEPYCLNQTNETIWNNNEIRFKAEISNETLAKQQILINLRNAANELSSLGVDINNIENVLNSIEETKMVKEQEEEKLVEKKALYKELLSLKHAVEYSKSKTFLCEGMLTQKEIVTIKAQLDSILPEEPVKKSEKEIKEEKQEQISENVAKTVTNSVYVENVLNKSKEKTKTNSLEL